MFEFDMRTPLRHFVPSLAKQGFVHSTRFSARPDAHAIARVKLIDEGGSSSQCSTLSATARNAIAYAFTIASCLSPPYAIAPGTSGISAIHRPSFSRSISMLNRKSWLPIPCGGLRSVITHIRCHITELGSCDRGHLERRGNIPQGRPLLLVN